MCKMIINADDFGYCRAVNHGIADAHLYGVLTSTTLLTNTPGFSHAAALSGTCKNLGIGLHLNIALGRPLTKGASLTGPDGYFIKPSSLLPGHIYEREEVCEELEAQYRKFTDTLGRKPTHLDSHLFTTDHNPVMEAAAIELAKNHCLPLRNHDIPGFPHVDFIQFRTYGAESGLDYVEEHIEDIASRPFVELMSHPAYADTYLMESSSYNWKRLGEFDFLVRDRTRKMLREHSVELIHYGQLDY